MTSETPEPDEAVGKAVDKIFGSSRVPINYEIEEGYDRGYKVSMSFSDGSKEFAFLKNHDNAVTLFNHLRTTGGQWINHVEVFREYTIEEGDYKP